jgi:hypothetical protein
VDVFFTGFQFCNYKFGSVTFVRHFFLCGFPVLRVKGLTNKLDSLGTFVYPNLQSQKKKVWRPRGGTRSSSALQMTIRADYPCRPNTLHGNLLRRRMRQDASVYIRGASLACSLHAQKLNDCCFHPPLTDGRAASLRLLPRSVSLQCTCPTSSSSLPPPSPSFSSLRHACYPPQPPPIQMPRLQHAIVYARRCKCFGRGRGQVRGGSATMMGLFHLNQRLLQFSHSGSAKRQKPCQINANVPNKPQWSLACSCTGSPSAPVAEMGSVQASCSWPQRRDCGEKSMRSKRQAAAKRACTRWRALRLRTVSQVAERGGGEPRAVQAEVGEGGVR